MPWAICGVVVIGAGLPLAAWLATRRLARRPPAALEPYHGRVDSWIHRRYGLAWAECSLIRTAVEHGRRVSSPALEDAAHRLAAVTVRGKVPGMRTLGAVVGLRLVVGVGLIAVGSLDLSRSLDWLLGVVFMAEGAVLFAGGWLSYSRVLRRLRRNALRALELNQAAAGPATAMTGGPG